MYASRTQCARAVLMAGCVFCMGTAVVNTAVAAHAPPAAAVTTAVVAESNVTPRPPHLRRSKLRQMAPAHVRLAGHLTGLRPFSDAQMQHFLRAAQHAEAMTDPMRRCLAYPDPPGSHWQPDVVKAYCRYHVQPTISFAQIKALVDAGKAAQIDRRLAGALHAQRTSSQSLGVLDTTYFRDFSTHPQRKRSVLDAWKTQSPDSAFAYAASGFAYAFMALNARGSGFIQDTPHSRISAMSRFAARANADLQHAVTLDPHVTPAYVAMLYIGRVAYGKSYIRKVSRSALAAAPSDYSIYEQLMQTEEPKWLGSLKRMRHVVDLTRPHVADNPLLQLLASAPKAYQHGMRFGRSPTDWADFPKILDKAASIGLLNVAGDLCAWNGQTQMAVVYLSEMLRFAADQLQDRTLRSLALTDIGDPAWALHDANQLVKRAPDKASSFDARAYAYLALGDDAHAVKDLRKANAMDPERAWPLRMLGNVYIYHLHDWNRAWNTSSRMIQLHPDDPTGWMQRVNIEVGQPRDGLADTVHRFVARFGNRPGMKPVLSRMRAALAQRKKAGAAGH